MIGDKLDPELQFRGQWKSVLCFKEVRMNSFCMEYLEMLCKCF